MCSLTQMRLAPGMFQHIGHRLLCDAQQMLLHFFGQL